MPDHEPGGADASRPLPPPRRSHRSLWIAVLTAVALLSVWFYVVGTPTYSLYRFASALQSRDVARALAYVDVDRVAEAAADILVADAFARQRPPRNVFEAMGQGIARSTAQQSVKFQAAARVRAEVQRMAEMAGQGSAMPVGLLAVIQGADMVRQGDEVWVTYTDPSQGITRFKMSRQPDRFWKITAFDQDWVLVVRNSLYIPGEHRECRIPRLPPPEIISGKPRTNNRTGIGASTQRQQYCARGERGELQKIPPMACLQRPLLYPWNRIRGMDARDGFTDEFAFPPHRRH